MAKPGVPVAEMMTADPVHDKVVDEDDDVEGELLVVDDTVTSEVWSKEAVGTPLSVLCDDVVPDEKVPVVWLVDGSAVVSVVLDVVAVAVVELKEDDVPVDTDVDAVVELVLEIVPEPEVLVAVDPLEVVAPADVVAVDVAELDEILDVVELITLELELVDTLDKVVSVVLVEVVAVEEDEEVVEVVVVLEEMLEVVLLVVVTGASFKA